MPPSKDGWSWSYGDNMILAERIFSQSAPGEVATAYFFKFWPIFGVCWGEFFRKHAPFCVLSLLTHSTS